VSDKLRLLASCADKAQLSQRNYLYDVNFSVSIREAITAFLRIVPSTIQPYCMNSLLFIATVVAELKRLQKLEGMAG